MTEIKVLGPGCPKCKTTYSNVLTTPVLMINGEMKVALEGNGK